MPINFFSCVDDVSNFKDCTLILPSLSIGNVGQFAVDLLISTIKFPKVGYLESPHVVPCVGNDAFKIGSGEITTSLEVFFDKNNKIALVQQRSPVVGRHFKDFATDLLAWIKQSNFRQVLWLHSGDSTRRIDTQLRGSQFRYWNIASNEQTPSSWTPLETESIDNVIRKGTLTRYLADLAKEQNVPLFVVLLFCAEGNNIPEATEMCRHLSQYLKIDNFDGNWISPDTWKLIDTPLFNSAAIF